MGRTSVFAVPVIRLSIQTAIHDYYAGLADVKESKFKNYKVSEANLNAMLETGEDFYLLSIRSEKDFGSAHIGTAENLPWGAGMELGFADLPKFEGSALYA